MKNLKKIELLIFVIILMIVLDYSLYINHIGTDFLQILIGSLIGFSIVVLIGLFINNKMDQRKKEIETLLYYDQVTNLPNKNKFLLELEHFIKDKYCVIAFDMKNFKTFVDLNGITETNKFLKFIADVLTAEITKEELCAHINEDNFALALKYTNDQQIVTRIEGINKKITSYSKNLNIKLSFGIYVMKDKRLSTSLILNKANISRKSVCDNYNSLYAFYSDKMKNNNMELSDIENYMEESLSKKQFIIYFQPKYHLQNNKISGLEALVRWIHPKNGILFPDKFIPAFEKNNFIMKLDLYILEEVCKLLNKWQKDNIELVPVSVNLSRANLNNQELISQIQKIIKKHNIQPKHIEFEFTENIIFNNMNAFLNVVKQLHQIGYKISIDDFGAGHSSLNILKKLPVDTLKIDKEFLNENNKKGEIIIANTINMAKELDMKVLVEGVETKEQVKFLKDLKCNYGQGYYYNKPMPNKEIEKLLRKNK